MTRVAITGPGGQVGRALLQAVPAGVEGVAIGRSVADLSVPGELTRALNDASPDFVVNAAAYTAVDRAEEEPALAKAVNEDAVAELAAWCGDHGVPWITISTDYVFDGNLDRPYIETDPPNPQCVYGQTKLAGEHVAASSPRARILRTSWVFGDGHNFVRTMVRLMKERDDLRVVADQSGVPTYAGWIAECIWAIVQDLERLPPGIYHLAGGPATTWYGFAQEIAGVCGFETRIEPIPTAAYPTPAKRPTNSVLDASKIRERMGWPMHDWRPDLHAYLATLDQ